MTDTTDYKVLSHLYANGITASTASPALSAIYASRFFDETSNRKLNLPDAIRAEFCGWCKAVLIPGFDSTFNIKSCKKKRKRGKNENKQDSKDIHTLSKVESKLKSIRILDFIPLVSQGLSSPSKNYVVMQCNVCDTVNRFKGSSKANVKTQKSVARITKVEDIKADNSKILTSMQKVNETKTAQVRKKRKKDLKSLLEASKRKTVENQEPSFQLSDFLGQL